MFIMMMITSLFFWMAIILSFILNMFWYVFFSRMKQRFLRKKALTQTYDPYIRRKSSAYRSRRSIRSGYAFAHQEGFGQLITSGKIMRKAQSYNLHVPNTHEQSSRMPRSMNKNTSRVQPASYNPPTSVEIDWKCSPSHTHILESLLQFTFF